MQNNNYRNLIQRYFDLTFFANLRIPSIAVDFILLS